ncbi:unnamed protein product [Darwinula stevensoni]|uniref:Ig-like domain-containing protein n=1 Tax=Darwinula stevensoni TaxID=69355 RepID=A0A7R8X2B7_9CRUS|nr:unnamed protein product [Darwinula stevensoni]CAG0881271.1 unnamed protein product [Darwinula stevensoni]
MPNETFLFVLYLVRPLHIELTGGDGPIREGAVVTLVCRVEGAKPPANITWFNGSDPLPLNAQPRSSVAVQVDGTYETQSRLTFTAGREDHGAIFTCEAANSVLEELGEEPMKTSVQLDITYEPTVRMSPLNATVNETEDVWIFCTYDANPRNLTSVLWYKDGRELRVHRERYGGGIPENPSLLIRNTSREDSGEYACYVENSVGISHTSNSARLQVHYPPEVFLSMEPRGTVSELQRPNITLSCGILSGNPRELQAVRWYMDGDLLKELPECVRNGSSPWEYDYDYDLCDIDPTKMLLEAVGRKFIGNYSCEGRNEAGWSRRSADVPLNIHYPPGESEIMVNPEVVTKGNVATLTCLTEEPGNPPAMRFRWLRGNLLLNDVTSPTLRIEPVSLQTRSNFTCIPVNEEGEGEPASVNVSVSAPPTFIDRLPPYHGALLSGLETRISCRVECSPLCTVMWLKNEVLVKDGEGGYSIKTNVLPPDPATNDFESVLSTLSWNMNVDIVGSRDQEANYTCRSTGNGIGPGVTSTTYFHVEYPPENISVSSPYVDVREGDRAGGVTCTAHAYPEPTYTWRFGAQVVSSGPTLLLDYEIKKSMAGEYDCVAENRHGKITAKTYINVLYKPECVMKREEVSGEIRLTCEVQANPKEVTFTWLFGNETLSRGIRTKGLRSSYVVQQAAAAAAGQGNYVCLVNNSLGPAESPCEMELTELGGWMELDEDNMIMIGALAAAAVLILLIILIIVIICCRKKRTPEKFVTFRRSSGESAPSGTGRKRKKPGDDGSTGGKGEDDWPGEKLFYENLPFHGLQAPPNKIEPEPEPQNPLPPAATPPAPTLSGGNGSRPPSELSQNGSSGYGSTRSQSDHPPQVTQVLGFGSLRARKNTGASFLSARALLFSSLRFPSKTRNDNQIQSHADLQGVAEDSELGIPIVPYNPRENETEGAVAPPRAAPRAPRARHVYLNVPFPQPLGAEENSDQHQRHRHHEGGLSTLSLSRMATLPVQQKFPAVHHPPPPPPARLIRPPSHLPDEYVEVAYASPYPVLPRPVADNIPRSSQGLRHPRSSGVKVKDNLYPGKRGANPTPAALHFRESGLGQEIDV